MIPLQKNNTCRCGCQGKHTPALRINKIGAIAQPGTHPAGCCSENPPLAVSACSTTDSCCAPKTGEHSHTSDDGNAEGSPGEDEPASPLSGSQQYSWKVQGMDCPACARKIEKAVSGIDGISHAKVLFATEKLVIDAGFDITQHVQNAVTAAGFTLQSLDKPQEKPTAEPSRLQEALPLIALSVLMLLSWVLDHFNPQMGNIAFIATTLVGLWPVLRQAIRQTRAGSPFAIETLMSIAAIGALFIGATAEAAMVLLLFMVGERLEAFASSRARSGVKALMALIPDTAVRIVNGKSETVPVSSLRPGDIIEIAAGARLPADAVLQSAASFDESALTGESVPVDHLAGEKVPAGSLCVDRLARLEVASAPGNSAIDRILQLIEEADERRAPIERFLDTFSRYYTPVIMLMSLLVIIVPPLAMGLSWETWIYRGLTLLLIGCPCALVISTPAAITSGLAAATRQGALIKGGAALEQLALIQTVALDKTGTLTEGKPEVTDVLLLNGASEGEVLSLASAVEEGSHHPLAQAILARAKTSNPLPLTAQDRRALAGSGVEGLVSGRKIQVLAPKSVAENSLTTETLAQITDWESSGKTVVVVLQEENAIGLIAMQDRLRDDAAEALQKLKALGVSAVMLTGDNPRAAKTIADRLGIDFRAGLLPADKVSAVTALNALKPVAMVGDGINDAPAMKAATIGIAMGSGTDVALETADAALTHNRLSGLAQMISLSRATRANIRQNITIALGLKAIFLVTTLMGLTGLWLAVLADSGATALVTANALRLLRNKSK
ncbi:zinc/cadmium/mercury/lead-transporting ATPase [Rahnella aceris]|jgi:Cd2+/Zn2+-exporting ATPase|uniref:zinc/cadmium/mercury/lead-transporting ATPase n=1 Tax=Rahnella sp. (strain Y9602) TaxID=2703885 RepID=UPI000EB33BB6|nr:zinc/cadmium/mercury/lead-transporting ATPase [Rahnella aceris]MBU9862629.1 zinc/cadmium/mercury/lead-transporting ATPase [Rahnella aceris]MBU9865986.1 zinc/cadmium/mercury/lead-transporting ATPase [Rahnella aceris]RKT64246.1 Cd2+/Zn2+-exporting ATPase [Rahnella aquatilis]